MERARKIDSTPPAAGESAPAEPARPAPAAVDLDDLRASFLGTLAERCPRIDLELVGRAYDVARAAHGVQLRSSGDPYLTHTVHTCLNLADLLENRLDAAVACAALLHDTVEDTSVTLPAIREQFGEEVAWLVDGVTKISGFHFDSAKTEQAENFRKMLLSMARDLRVMFIKLADR